jgi:hypothetical protein
MNEHGLPEGMVGAEHLGVRVFCISAADAQQLADQLALVLGEHMAGDDEVHLTYSAVQSGWEHDPGRPGWLGRSPHTHLFLEYTAILVLRSASAMAQQTPM